MQFSQNNIKQESFSKLKEQAFSEVILFVDNREKRNQNDGSYLYDRLKKNGLTVELKSLPLGDFLWVLRVYNDQYVKQKKKENKKKQT